jgi:hypothetical protein
MTKKMKPLTIKQFTELSANEDIATRYIFYRRSLSIMTEEGGDDSFTTDAQMLTYALIFTTLVTPQQLELIRICLPEQLDDIILDIYLQIKSSLNIK